MRRSSIGTWAFNIGPYAESPIPFADVLAKLAELKFDGLELGGLNGYPDPRNHPAAEDRERLAAEVAAVGLAFSGFVPDLGGERLLNTRDTSDYVASFKANCDFAADLGIGGIRVDTVQPPTIHREAEYGDLLARLVATWDRCIGYAGDKGLRVSWELEPGCAFNKPSDVQRVLDRLQHDHFGVLYDTCHAELVAVVGARQEGRKETLAGGQLELIRRLSGRINHIHLSDSDGRDASSAHLPLGEGMLDFAALLPALTREEVGHDWWTIDLAFWPDAWAAMPRCKAALDDLIKSYG